MSVECIKFEGLLIAATGLSSIFAIYMTIERHQGYATINSSYQQLYDISPEVAVAEFSFDDSGELDVRLQGLRSDSASIEAGGEFESERIKILPGQNEYFLSAYKSGDEPAFRAMWGSNIPVPAIGNPAISIGVPSHGLSDFAASADELNQEHVNRAREIAIEEFGVNLESSKSDKLRALSLGLYQALFPHRGFPPPYMRRLDGYQQYVEALAGRSGIYCGNHAEILAFFATSIGIPTRIVDMAGRYDDVALGAHAFVESYHAEKDTWQYIDLQLGILGVLDENGRYLNAADLLHRMAANSSNHLAVDALGPNGIYTVRFESIAEEVGMFIHPQAELVYLWSTSDRYHPANRLLRLLFKPRLSYSMRTASAGAKIRLAVTYLFAALAAFWLILRFRHHIGWCGCNRP
ncbi:MAG: transglutaminase domain-containing protein [Gammaproteobacteria bacterium]|nr:transglutaminase domain-containing protein [Gammaproteobacteria bacterium]